MLLSLLVAFCVVMRNKRQTEDDLNISLSVLATLQSRYPLALKREMREFSLRLRLAKKKRMGVLKYAGSVLACRPLKCQRDMKAYEIPLGLRAAHLVNTVLADCEEDSSSLSEGSGDSDCHSLLGGGAGSVKSLGEKIRLRQMKKKPYRPRIILSQSDSYLSGDRSSASSTRARPHSSHVYTNTLCIVNENYTGDILTGTSSEFKKSAMKQSKSMPDIGERERKKVSWGGVSHNSKESDKEGL